MVRKIVNPNKKISEKEVRSKAEIPKSGDILNRIQPVKETESFLTMLLYGRSGTGKTTIACTCPSPVLLMDFKDRGTDSVRDVPGVKVLYVNDWEDIPALYWALKKSNNYKTVVLDTISGMQSLAINKVRADNNKEDTEPLSKREWGEISGIMSQWIMAYRDLPMHVVFTAQDRVKAPSADEEDLESEEGQIDPEVGPAVIPSVAKTVNAAVKVIGNTYIKQFSKEENGKITVKTRWMLRLGPHPYYITKVRSPKSFLKPDGIIDPTYEKIVKIMKGER